LVQNYGISADLAQELAPYIGITGQPALTFIDANPLTLTNEETTNLDDSFWTYAGASVAAKFNSAQTFGAGFTFSQLPSNTETAIADMYWHYGPSIFSSNLWTQIITGNWQAAANNIETWGDPNAVARNNAMGNLIQQDINSGLLPTPRGGVH
jgi:hypothetical protein